MSVLLETSLGDIVIDLEVELAPRTCENFLKLCKTKYYNFSPVTSIQRGRLFQTGDPLAFTKLSNGGTSIWGQLPGRASNKHFPAEFHPKLNHSAKGTVSMATAQGRDVDERVSASQFIITLEDNLNSLDEKLSPFGHVVEGLEVLDKVNKVFCNSDGVPIQDIRILHTICLEDPFPDPDGLDEPPGSPIPSKAQLDGQNIPWDEQIHEDVTEDELEKRRREREAKAQALTLEMIGDLPFAEVAPPENVLFVCKLNPVTGDDDLRLIFSQFGPVLSSEVIRDRRTGDSLQYAFIEYQNKEDCGKAYYKMEGVLIDDRRIHVDFSQSVSRSFENWRDDTNAKRRKNAARGYGGNERLEARSQYRNLDGRGRDNGSKTHDMVFDDDEVSRSAGEGRRDDHRKDSRRSSRSPRRDRDYSRRDEKDSKHRRRSRSRDRDRHRNSPPSRRDRSRERYDRRDDHRRYR